jgi:hypothetical protein
LPHLQATWYTRSRRPLPESVQFSLLKFEKIWIVDCSIIADGVMKKATMQTESIS